MSHGLLLAIRLRRAVQNQHVLQTTSCWSPPQSFARRGAQVVPLDSVKGTASLSLSLLLSVLRRCWCLDHRLHPCFPISGRRACSLIFCFNHLTHCWLKGPLIFDFSKAATSSCREGADIHLLEQCSPPLLRALLGTPCQQSRGVCELGAGKNRPEMQRQGPAASCLQCCAAGHWVWIWMLGQVPGTLQAAPSQRMAFVPCPSTSWGCSAASFSCHSLWSGAARFSTGCCGAQRH